MAGFVFQPLINKNHKKFILIRYMSQTKHSDALVLVYDGATMLLQHEQVNIHSTFTSLKCQPILNIKYFQFFCILGGKWLRFM